jgi:hypothetical protein
MLKYLTKFALDVLPSVVATILGAYIVNHYINTKSDTDAPAAAVASTADPKNLKNDPKNDKNDPKSADVVKIPEPGVKAKGISERAMIEKSASEGPAEVKPVETKPAENKPVENKPAEAKPAEIANAPAEPRRAPPAREKALAKATPAPITAPAAIANPAPAAETNATPEERRDANDLARAAIERLRGATANSQEATRQPERAQDRTVGERTVAAPPVVRPLPPPIAVAAPPADGNNGGSPPYTASIRNDDPNRPTPPAEIPSPPPLDLRAAANEATTAKERAKAVAEDMLSAAKSMFHTVLPQ